MQKKRQEEWKGQRNREFAGRLCLHGFSKAIKKSHKRDYLNTSGTRTTPIYMLQWAGRAHVASTLHKDILMTKEYRACPGKRTPIS